MSVHKRCHCESWLTCPHPYHYRFGWRAVIYRGSTRERTKQLAERAEGEKLAALKRGETTGRKIPTLGKYLPEFEAWIESHQTLRPQSKLFYKRGVKLLAASPLAKMHLDRITDTVCVGIRFGKAGPATENTALRTLRRVFAHIVKGGWMVHPPRLSLRPEEGRKLVLDDAYEQALAPFLPEDSRDAIRLMRETGCRIGEILSMSWLYVDWEHSCYRVPRGKTKNSERTVLLASAGLEVLHRRHLEQGLPKQGWIFPCGRASSGHRESIDAEFRTARKQAGLPKELVPYCARHDAATNYMRITGNPKLVMQLLGHSDIQTTSRYVHPHAGEVQKIRDVFDLRNGGETAKDSTNATHAQNDPSNLQNLKPVSDRRQ